MRDISRRYFLETTAAAAAATSLPLGGVLAQGKAKYTRYNVMSAGGKKALESYRKAVEIMLRLPADDPHNWFRNAFVHFMDCPHGNWWFYVWHRGFLGFFERVVRELSGDKEFAFPYWDWTTLPQIPDGMFDGVLTPRDNAYEPFTGNLEKFTKFIQPTLMKYWDSLSHAQRQQLDARGYTKFDQVWFDVQGAVDNPDPNKIYAVAGNMAFAPTCGARYLTRDNPLLEGKAKEDVKPFIVSSGLKAPDFYNDEGELSFNSSKTASHNTQPSGATKFSTLEGMPHNKVHNYIGGYGPLNYGPYGNMTNNLSPVDPIFFLHHSNMDRLWDVWTRRQKAYGRDWRPAAADAKTYFDEPFLFFIDEHGKPVANGKAADFFNMEVFEYDYEPGFGEDLTRKPVTAVAVNKGPRVKGRVSGNTGAVALTAATVQNNSDDRPLMAEITIQRSASENGAREFDVIVGAPPGTTSVTADSPYYAGTIAFFGHMSGMKMPMEATFSVPISSKLVALAQSRNLAAAPHGARPANATTTLNIGVVSTSGGSGGGILKDVTVGVR
jgi:tyrosinase